MLLEANIKSRFGCTDQPRQMLSMTTLHPQLFSHCRLAETLKETTVKLDEHTAKNLGYTQKGPGDGS